MKLFISNILDAIDMEIERFSLAGALILVLGVIIGGSLLAALVIISIAFPWFGLVAILLSLGRIAFYVSSKVKINYLKIKSQDSNIK